MKGGKQGGENEGVGPGQLGGTHVHAAVVLTSWMEVGERKPLAGSCDRPLWRCSTRRCREERVVLF